MAIDNPALFKPEEAARYLGVSRAHLFKLLARCEVRSVLVGGRCRRIPIEALNDYIRRLQSEQPAHTEVA